MIVLVSTTLFVGVIGVFTTVAAVEDIEIVGAETCACTGNDCAIFVGATFV